MKKNTSPKNSNFAKNAPKNCCCYCGIEFGNFSPSSDKKIIITSGDEIIGWVCGIGNGCSDNSDFSDDDNECV